MNDSQTNSRASSPFDAKVVLAMIGIGALLFLALLYILGTGEPNRDTNNGGGHALSNGMSGYSAFAKLLETQGHPVDFVRSQAALDEENLLILTPPFGTSAEELARIVEQRRYTGPTIIIMPKWMTMRIAPREGAEQVKPGWVNPFGTNSLGGIEELAELADAELTIDDESSNWDGLGLSGKLPAMGQMEPSFGMAEPEENSDADKPSTNPSSHIVQWIKAEGLAGMVRDNKGRMLAGYLNDDYFPDLAQVSGNAIVNGPAAGDESDDYAGNEMWPVVIVAEPDLLNNLGFADFNTANQGLALVDATLDGYDLPIMFDVTLNGLGGSQNLLTLAFTPPFLAATICLIIAALLVGWRAFLRFGPALAEGRRIAFGKEQLVTNSAGLINRAKRTHLLAEPYIALMRRRIAKTLGLRQRGEAATIDEAIDRAMAVRTPDQPPFSHQAQSLRAAGNAQDILRRAEALKSLERTLDEQ